MQDQIHPIAKKILNLLLFEESFIQIVEEIRESNSHEIADELKNLIVKDFVRPVKDIENDSNSKMMYDSDKMRAYSFIITAKGLQYLENNLK